PEIGLYVGLVLWAIIGGGVALTNTVYETRQAIFAGIAAPAIIASFVAGGAPQGTNTNKDKSMASLLGIAAMAQEVAPQIGVQEAGALLVSPRVTGGLPRTSSIPITAEVKDASGNLKMIDLGVISDLSAPSAFALPA